MTLFESQLLVEWSLRITGGCIHMQKSSYRSLWEHKKRWTATYQRPNNFHQLNPTTIQIGMFTKEAINPIVHQRFCVT